MTDYYVNGIVINANKEIFVVLEPVDAIDVPPLKKRITKAQLIANHDLIGTIITI